MSALPPAMAGDMAGAKVAAAQVVRLDPNWSVEKYLMLAAIQTMPPCCSSRQPERLESLRVCRRIRSRRCPIISRR